MCGLTSWNVTSIGEKSPRLPRRLSATIAKLSIREGETMNDIRFTNSCGNPRLIVLMEDKNWQFLDTIFAYIYEALDGGKSISMTIEKNERLKKDTVLPETPKFSMLD